MQRVSLDTLGGGAALELFHREMTDHVLPNIADPNTPATKPRTITLEIKITPTEKRDFGVVEVVCKSKLQAMKPFGAGMHIGVDPQSGEVVATTSGGEQQELS